MSVSMSIDEHNECKYEYQWVYTQVYYVSMSNNECKYEYWWAQWM